jgi:hypothetical protein
LFFDILTPFLFYLGVGVESLQSACLAQEYIETHPLSRRLAGCVLQNGAPSMHRPTSPKGGLPRRGVEAENTNPIPNICGREPHCETGLHNAEILRTVRFLCPEGHQPVAVR